MSFLFSYENKIISNSLLYIQILLNAIVLFYILRFRLRSESVQQFSVLNLKQPE